jgi:uncharacterized protein YbbC (DUF1343 family)
VQIVVTDPHAFRSVRTAVEIMTAIKQISPAAISIRSSAMFDRDWGTDQVRAMLESGAGPDAIVSAWEPKLRAFAAIRERFLLY